MTGISSPTLPRPSTPIPMQENIQKPEEGSKVRRNKYL
jgi:hypothetical protein